MTTFTITERGGWWFPTVRHHYGKLIAYAGRVGIIEAAKAVADVWPDARLIGIL